MANRSTSQEKPNKNQRKIAGSFDFFKLIIPLLHPKYGRILNKLLELNAVRPFLYISQQRLADMCSISDQPEVSKITTLLHNQGLIEKIYRGPYQTCYYRINSLFKILTVQIWFADLLPALTRYISIWQEYIQFLDKTIKKETTYRKVTNFYVEDDDDVGFRYEHPPFC